MADGTSWANDYLKAVGNSNAGTSKALTSAMNVAIYSVIGDLVHESKTNQTKTQLDLSYLSNGVCISCPAYCATCSYSYVFFSTTCSACVSSAKW
jgi:hypothetical protein